MVHRRTAAPQPLGALCARHIGTESAAQLPHIWHPSNLPHFACRPAQVGGASEVEVGEKKDRITDALNATKVG